MNAFQEACKLKSTALNYLEALLWKKVILTLLQSMN